MKQLLILLFAIALVVGLGWTLMHSGGTAAADEPTMPQKDLSQYAKAYFAGGCFWCTESDFESVPGVVEVVSGYAGGHVDNPSYEEVSGGTTGHAESIEVYYDPDKVTYKDLLDVFWHSVDPTDAGGQFCDRGTQYRSEIFYASDEQKKEAEASKAEIEKTKPFKAPIVTQIEPLKHFWPAEDYHQNFYKTHTIRYKTYRAGCGRDARVRELWGDKAYHHE